MQKHMRFGIIAIAVILVLTTIQLPTQAQVDSDDCVNKHLILDGDTLLGIARRYNVNMQELALLNGITNPSYIRIGDILCLDGLVAALPAPGGGTGGPSTTPTATDTPTDTPEPAATVEPKDETPTAPPAPPVVGIGAISVTVGGRTYTTDAQGYYTVQRGDNLYRIALAFGLSIGQLAAVNNIPDTGVVYVGQRLLITPPTPSFPVPGSIPAISIQPRIAGPGDTVSVRGFNYPANTNIDLYLEKPSLNRKSDVLLTVTTDDAGTFAADVEIPAEWPDGWPINTRTVSISGYATGTVYWGMNFFINSAWSSAPALPAAPPVTATEDGDTDTESGSTPGTG